MGKQGNDLVAFGIRAPQANNITGSKSLQLSFGVVRREKADIHSLETNSDTMNTANSWVHEWVDYLMRETGMDIFKQYQTAFRSN